MNGTGSLKAGCQIWEAGSGRLHNVNRPDPNVEVEQVIWKNRLVIIDEMAGELKISHGSVQHIMLRTAPKPKSLRQVGIKSPSI